MLLLLGVLVNYKKPEAPPADAKDAVGSDRLPRPPAPRCSARLIRNRGVPAGAVELNLAVLGRELSREVYA